MKFRLSMLTDKKVRLAALLVVTALSVAVSGTLCYFAWSTLSIPNTFIPARLNIVIHEEFARDEDGDYVKKDVSFENVVIPDATSRAYIRVKLVPSWRDAYGNVAGVPAVDILSTPGITAVINTDLTYDYVDGYYYYKGVLEPGEQTSVLIHSFKVDYSAFAGTVYEGLNFELSVLAEGLDSAIGAAETAWGMSYNDAAHTWAPA
ncbi:MAG: hypothetical protein K6G90_12605 [Clostridia bacterium]|nr:hypothetical protein [Clostridia bacterium]